MTQLDSLTTNDMLALLNWYKSVGVDMCVSDSSVDQFSLTKVKTKPASAMPQTLPGISGGKQSPLQAPLIDVKAFLEKKNEGPKTPLTAQAPIEGAKGDPEQAKNLALSASNFEDLRAKLNNLEGCALRMRATQLVFGDGNPEADIMFIGKAPGRDEDIQGRTFAGRSGDLLDNMLKAIGLTRSALYLANIVPWRPPGDRNPAPHEIAMCLPFLKRQIEFVAPKIVVCLGEVATRTLLGEDTNLINSRGKWHKTKIGGHDLRILTSLHPDFLLKQPAQKRQVWLDLQMIKREIEAS